MITVTHPWTQPAPTEVSPCRAWLGNLSGWLGGVATRARARLRYSPSGSQARLRLRKPAQRFRSVLAPLGWHLLAWDATNTGRAGEAAAPHSTAPTSPPVSGLTLHPQSERGIPSPNPLPDSQP